MGLVAWVDVQALDRISQIRSDQTRNPLVFVHMCQRVMYCSCPSSTDPQTAPRRQDNAQKGRSKTRPDRKLSQSSPFKKAVRASQDVEPDKHETINHLSRTPTPLTTFARLTIDLAVLCHSLHHYQGLLLRRSARRTSLLQAT